MLRCRKSPNSENRLDKVVLYPTHGVLLLVTHEDFSPVYSNFVKDLFGAF